MPIQRCNLKSGKKRAGSGASPANVILQEREH